MNKGAIIIVGFLLVAVIIVFVMNRKAEMKRQEQMASQNMTAAEEAALMQSILHYKTEIESRQEDQKFRWQDLFMGQAAVSEGVGNIFLGMGSMGGG